MQLRRDHAAPRRASAPRQSQGRDSVDSGLLLAELQLPRLADELFSEGVVRLVLDELEAHALVDAAGGGEHPLGPERDLAVARLACKAQSFLDQAGADAEAARLGLDQEEAQPRDLVRVPH